MLISLSRSSGRRLIPVQHPFRPLVLHVGTVKTGSTSLQAYLMGQQSWLNQQGWCYLPAPGRRDRRDLAAACIALGDQRDELLRGQGLLGDQQRLLHRSQVRQVLEDQLATLPPEQGVILSSEHFHLSLQRPEEIDGLKQLLLALGLSPIQVVIYLREPVGLMESLYSTMVRAGDDRPLPADPADPFVAMICDHPDSLQRWRSAFGEEAVLARRFPPRHGIGHDLLDQLGHFSQPFPPEPRHQSNRGFNPRAVHLLRQLNRMFPWCTPQSPHRLVRGVRRLLDSLLSRCASGSYRMPEVQRQRYQDCYGKAYEHLLEQEGLR